MSSETTRRGWIGPGGDAPRGLAETNLWLARDDLRMLRVTARVLIALALLMGAATGFVVGRFA